MIALVLGGVLITVGVAGFTVYLLRHRSGLQLDAMERATRKTGLASEARTDLPPEVSGLAARMGARSAGVPGYAIFEQTGQMWLTPGGKPTDFTARQTVRVDETAFCWRATMGPPTWVVVVDYFIAGIGGLEVKALGAFTVAQVAGGATANQGEALRYLAELPWNPDAILLNRSLEWTVVDARTMKVATGRGDERGEVTFQLDEQGLVVRMSAPSRTYGAGAKAERRPWHGRFWDYQSIGGRFLPCSGEVSWVLDAGDFTYWRGRLLNWHAPPPSK